MESSDASVTQYEEGCNIYNLTDLANSVPQVSPSTLLHTQH